MRSTGFRELRRLAFSHGIQIAYRDIRGQRQTARPEALMAVLRALGTPIERPDDAPELLRARDVEQWSRRCEPVVVAWDDVPADLPLRLPSELDAGRLAAVIALEDGSSRELRVDLGQLPVTGSASVDGRRYVLRSLPLPEGLPRGYHRLSLGFPDGGLATATVIAAPRRAWQPSGEQARLWGTFLPLYALTSDRSWSAGNFSDLADLLEWTKRLGGQFTGTLPLLAAYLDEPFEISPYAPVSRLFWNEFYLDVTALAEFQASRAARDLVNSRDFQDELRRLRRDRLVDYRHGMRLRRRVLELLARQCWETPGPRREELETWRAAHPEAERYAAFRATVERYRAGWSAWPEPLRSGQRTDGDPDVARYHLYVQWAAEQQVRQLAQRHDQGGQGLYLDLPVGVHPDGFDTWRFRDLFIQSVSAGAPPDPFFDEGQVWGFPPLHPERQREDGYGYLRACLQHHLCHAGMLRIDHVMGLHRLYLIPAGSSGRDGVYIRYPAEEMYAVLALESHRGRCIVVGEDLGTAPDAVRRAMARHGLLRMYVLPFELRPGGQAAAPPRNALACLDTHDLPPFAALWGSWPAQERQRLLAWLRQQGCLTAVEGDEALAALHGFLAFLAASPAQALVVNLEDLWLETEPQNRPGTGLEQPNWRRKARYALEDVTNSAALQALLAQIDRLRRQGGEA
ncbi:4-alpha-glucanotransferase [Thermomicrobiaceae bacterium CFH 74404]|uniref:4-alpha-glucanotransferase n=1 Tax=Thermalbibacter longus TaxID=2951981 RepID=A0AA42BAJ5_9BACT|nr:4-alpha-glucanotransferase [Thermalbibacter longus]MCM8748605.1 4-alpha-glucanotransferase [Thermalbibacter longus]